MAASFIDRRSVRRQAEAMAIPWLPRRLPRGLRRRRRQTSWPRTSCAGWTYRRRDFPDTKDIISETTFVIKLNKIFFIQFYSLLFCGPFGRGFWGCPCGHYGIRSGDTEEWKNWFNSKNIFVKKAVWNICSAIYFHEILWKVFKKNYWTHLPGEVFLQYAFAGAGSAEKP